jgi:phenylacetate-CoA ligase
VRPWVARNLVYRPACWLRGEPVFRLLRRYEETQWWSPERLAGLQEETLGALLRFATTRVPYYREAARRAGIAGERADVADLARLPLLTKADLVDHRAALSLPHLRGTATWKTTGGSTGLAVRVLKNRAATAAEQAASWRSYGWYGIRPGDRQARFWGVPLQASARLRFRAIDLALNRRRFSAFAFRRDDLRAYYERLVRLRPAWAYGYVSMLVQFAAFCLEQGLPLGSLGIRAVVTTSEVLTPGDRALLQEAFRTEVRDEYGCGEVGAILYECEKGLRHLMAENLWVELVPDPTAEEPAAHRLVVSDLHNRAMPLLRYDLGDRIVPAPPCTCGRGLPAFARVFGRAYDFVTASDGSRFHGEFFMYLLEEFRDRGAPIRQAQFVQLEPDRIEVRIVPGPGWVASHGQALAARLEEASEGRLRATATLVSELPRERSGKIRLVRRADAASP